MKKKAKTTPSKAKKACSCSRFFSKKTSDDFYTEDIILIQDIVGAFGLDGLIQALIFICADNNQIHPNWIKILKKAQASITKEMVE